MSEEEREKYEAIIADMAKMLELQQKSEGVVIDMIAAAVKAEREACAKVCDGWSKRDDVWVGLSPTRFGRGVRHETRQPTNC
jgi:hypothetical protein